MRKRRFEDAPYASPPDETDVNLRAYLDAIPDGKLDNVDLSWGDGRLRDWDGNFRNDGCLMLVCCDRDVRIGEFRRVLAEFLAFRETRAKQGSGLD